MANASGISVIATFGSIAKIGALILLLFLTIATNRSEKARAPSINQKITLTALWTTAGFAMVSIIWSASWLETLTEGGTVVILVYILHFASSTRWRQRTVLIDDFVAIYRVLLAVLALGSVLSFAGFGDAIGGAGRHQGLFANPNMLGVIAAVTFTIGVGIALEKRRLILWLILLIPLANVLLSESRTALVAIFVGVLWAVVRSKIILLIPLGFGVVLTSLVFAVAGINHFGGTIERFTESEEGDLLNSRTQAWQEVIWNIQENPLGAGWAAGRVAMEQFYNMGYTSSGIFTMHNSWFQIFNELGWVGFIPISLLIYATIRVALQADASGFGFGLVATILTGSMIHITESVMFGIGQPYPYIFWAAVLGATMSVPTKTKLPQHPNEKFPLPNRFHASNWNQSGSSPLVMP
ncbi:O-antigen ligase family protein [Corynebacterium ammoniagenes]|nr:O-antigen ligase family protein [Corynebacterium ammoniagenes]